MKSNKKVNVQVDEENQTQEGGAKKGTSNAKNYTSRCTGLGLHKMFVALPEEEKGILRATYFSPLLLIDPIATMPTLLRVSPIANKFLFDDPEQMNFFRMKRFPKKKNTYGLKEIVDVLKQAKLERHLVIAIMPSGTDMQQDLVQEAMRYQIKMPTIGAAPTIGTVPAIGVPAVIAPAIGSSSSATEIRAIVVRWKKGEEKDNDDKKDVEKKVKSEEEEVQEIMVVAEVAKTGIVFFNQEEVVGETYQASTDQTTVVSIEEQILVVKKNEDEASQVEQNKDEVFEGKDDDDGNSQNKPDPEQPVLMESEVDVASKKRHALTEKENNKNAFKMACRMSQLHAHLDELLPGVLLESFIQRPISQDEKSQVNHVWSLRKDKSTLEAKEGNRSTYMMIGEEPICLNALYTLYLNQWLDKEVIDVYIKALI
ncbi:hypothetical protein GIB67_029724 [Kingdonia uniflora]|uniref:Uncharacterized protein n=1 Tax=Kingdonia uniflora TaxID=39325 RepID=A0A7J7LLL2_9MAGN|nr:hypothetical protein GIB67_029724 [Kingdonia uniflora]